MVTPAEFLKATASGTRVVVRHLIDDGRATDALGYFHLADDSHCVVATRRGLETIELAKVIAAKEVPPPPAPRPRATS
ncbi:hypothetical protein [Rhodoglobus sp.]